MHPETGARVGRYELVRLLGVGGAGQVWEATLLGPRGFRRPVALKLLRVAGSDEDEALQHEARVGAMLHHPNVVAVHELGEADGAWFVAMELVRGPTVSELLGRGPLSAADVLEIGVQACAGLAHIHRAGLVHRDLKLRNLLLDESGLVKIADLGIAALAGSARAAGTWGYFPPEQAQGVAEPRSDLFALGVVLFRLATRRRPFPTDATALEVIAGLVEGAAADVQEAREVAAASGAVDEPVRLELLEVEILLAAGDERAARAALARARAAVARVDTPVLWRQLAETEAALGPS